MIARAHIQFEVNDLYEATKWAAMVAVDQFGGELIDIDEAPSGPRPPDVLELSEDKIIEHIPMREWMTPILSAKLDDMQLYDDTGDPYDEGYMRAVNELRDWLKYGDT